MDLEIKGKKAIMAGGSAGMGRATAERLAEAGVELTITARREERLLNAAKEISEQYGAKVTPVVADSSKEEGRQKLFEACPDPDILAITIKPPNPNGDFLKVTPEDWRESMGMDKKVLAGKMRFVMLESLGDSYVSSDYDDKRLTEILATA